MSTSVNEQQVPTSHLSTCRRLGYPQLIHGGGGDQVTELRNRSGVVVGHGLNADCGPADRTCGPATG